MTADWADLIQIHPGRRSKRASTWDRTGQNHDSIGIDAGETTVLADIPGAGIITHIYFTMISPDPMDYRDAVLRMYWDGEKTPSVEVPFGDFFCISNCTVRRFVSAMVTVNSGCGPHTVNNGLNCYFPMPFSNGARITLTNESDRTLGGNLGQIWFHIDYEEHDKPLPDNIGRFHAQWRRENTTRKADVPKTGPGIWDAANLTGDENYVMLEAKGRGHVAGMFLQVDNLQGGWYGEGDDMIFIDGDVWPPSQHGTGSEEVFGGGACPDKEYAGPYTGYVLIEHDGGGFKGKNAMYRWYLHDPIRFQESVRMTIEHGHANDCENDYSSVAYWYQEEPHAPFPVLPGLEARRPHMPEAFHASHAKMQQMRAILRDTLYKNVFQQPVSDWARKAYDLAERAYNCWYTKEFDQANALCDEALEVIRQEAPDAM